jgi:hypothetical protein
MLDISDIHGMQKTYGLVRSHNQVRTSIPLNNNGDSLVTYAVTRTHSYGFEYKEVNADTLYHNGNISTVKKLFVEKKLDERRYWSMVALVFIQILLVTMVYGPIAAFLVELFPTRIRYTSMSLPYHVGNGVFGGLTPFIATLLTTIYTDDKLVGLWYPIIIATVCMVIGILYVNNNIDPDVND